LCPGFESLIRHQKSSMRFLLAVVIASLALCSCGSPQTLPDGTIMGTMTTGQLPMVTIDGKEYRLAPGARIVGADNRSVTPNQVAAGSRVRYRLDSSGQVSQVWLLPDNR
jgi:hypothetical protein